MVVMDDGWYGKRNDDNSSLGDWYVNEEKLGGTLTKLIERVNVEGVKFGIWIEPEMVSEDSDLYREHPDWAITIPGRKPVRSRNQLVLDFSRKEVRDEIFKRICLLCKLYDGVSGEIKICGFPAVDKDRTICMDVFSLADMIHNAVMVLLGKPGKTFVCVR